MLTTIQLNGELGNKFLPELQGDIHQGSGEKTGKILTSIAMIGIGIALVATGNVSMGIGLIYSGATGLLQSILFGQPNPDPKSTFFQTSGYSSTTTVNVPVSVAVGSDSEVDAGRLSQAVQAMVLDSIRREMRTGGSINRGNPYSNMGD